MATAATARRTMATSSPTSVRRRSRPMTSEISSAASPPALWTLWSWVSERQAEARGQRAEGAGSCGIRGRGGAPHHPVAAGWVCNNGEGCVPRVPSCVLLTCAVASSADEMMMERGWIKPVCMWRKWMNGCGHRWAVTADTCQRGGHGVRVAERGATQAGLAPSPPVDGGRQLDGGATPRRW